jgi:beta-lactamase regulating signal transducer with metallopeptidase domain
MGTFVEIGLWNAAASAVLALLAAGLSRLCRRPALTHTLWLLVLLKLLTPPLVPFTLPWFAEEPPPAVPVVTWPVEAPQPLVVDVPEEAVAPVRDDEPAPEPPAAAATPFPWLWWIGTIWLSGLALWATCVVWNVVHFRRVLRRARLAPGYLQAEAEALAQRMRLRKCPNVWLVPGTVSPMVWSLGRSLCLLFPYGLLERLDERGRAALLVHELAHVRRRDHLVRLLELAATGLYWWNPVLWWARRELHEAEEQCCDAWGVWALNGDGRPYALALLQAVAFVSETRLPLPAGACGTVGQVSHLKRRLKMVMQGTTSRTLSWASLGLVLFLGLLLLPLFPALGQDRPAPEVKPAPAAAQPPKDARDQDIEVLKQAIRILEAQKEQDAVKHRTKVPVDSRPAVGAAPPPAWGVTDELKRLEQDIAVKRKELQDLEARAAALRAKMKAETDMLPHRTERFGPPPKDTQVDPVTGKILPRGERGAPQAKPTEDLEKKLDRLQKELEELRRELRRNPGPAGLTVPVPMPKPGYEAPSVPLSPAPDKERRPHDPTSRPAPAATPTGPATKPPPDATPAPARP